MTSAKIASVRELCCLGLDAQVLIPAVLAELHGTVPSVSNSFFWLDYAGQVGNMYDESPEAWRYMPVYLQEFLNRREREAVPALPELARHAKGVVTTAQVAKRGFYRSAFYNELLRPLNYHHSAATVVKEGDRPLGLLMLHRGAGDAEYRAEERRALLELRPFIAHGLASAGKFRFPSVKNGDIGVVILDRQGQPQHISDRAHQLLLMCNHPQFSPDRIRNARLDVPAEMSLLCSRLQGIAHAAARRPSWRQAVLPPVWRHDNPWGRFVLRAQWLDPVSRSDAGLIGVTIDHESPLPLRLHTQARRLGLSPRQVRVCGLLAAGCAYDQIATEMGISVHTVTDHVRKLFDKLNVSSRNELVTVLMSV